VPPTPSQQKSKVWNASQVHETVAVEPTRERAPATTVDEYFLAREPRGEDVYFEPTPEPGVQPVFALSTTAGSVPADSWTPAQPSKTDVHATGPAAETVDNGDLESAMRELRDEVRALRESMQGLRERLHTLGTTGKR
jgi:hypothetical protein